MVDGAANSEDVTVDVPYTLTDTAQNLLDAEASVISAAETVSLAEGETATVQQAQDLLALDNFDGVYDIVDTAENLMTENITKQGIINDADTIGVDGTATVDQIDTLNARYGEVDTYAIEDSWASIEAAATSILDNATAISLDAPVTVADAEGVINFAYDVDFNIEDTAANILAADQATLDEAEGVTVSAVEDALSVEQFTELMNRAELGEGVTYTLEDSLENLADADPNVVADAESWALTDAVDAFEGLLVENALTSDEQSILDGASNSDDYAYTLEDTLDNLVAAEEGVVSAADSYALSNDATDFEGLLVENALSSDQQSMLDGATNSGDYAYTLEDTLENLVAAEEGVLSAADSYALSNDATDFENLTVAAILSQDAVDTMNGASNAADYTYSLEDEADQFFSNGDVKEALVDILDDPDAITVTTAVTREQRANLNEINDNVEYEGGTVEGAFQLTTGVDEFTPTATDPADRTTDGKDEFKGQLAAAADGDATWTALDEIDGGGGEDTFHINDISGAQTVPSGITLTSVEIVNLRAAGDVGATGAGKAFDVSSFDDIENFNITTAEDVFAEAADTTNIDVSGATGKIEVAGGNNVTVTDATADQAISVGQSATNSNNNPVGTINVTDSAQGTGAIIIDGGTDVTVDTVTTSGTTTIGANAAATGAVNVTATGAEATNDNDDTMGAIAVTGGTAVDVNVSANEDPSVAEEFAKGATITQSAVTVTGDDSTTDVSITQDEAVAEETYTEAVEGVQQTKTVKFVELSATETVTVDGLTFTATKNLTADEVAQAFANLSASDTQEDGGPTANGYYEDNTTANWTSGEADGNEVTFTEVTAATADTPLNVADTAAAGNVEVTEDVSGVTEVAGNTGVLGVVGGAATVVDQDKADATIETITLDAYGAGSDIQGADALTTLNLANVDGIDLKVDAAVEALDLTLDNILGASVIDLDDSTGATNATLETLNISMVSDSNADIIADAATTLNVSGDGKLTTSVVDSTFAALENVVVSGAAGLVLTGTDPTVLETIDASATSGDVTATIDTSVTSESTAYKGGTGVDTVTLDANDTTVAAGIELGDGDDKLTLAPSTTAITGTVDAGEGTDTISMDTTSADNLDDDVLNASGFEQLELTDATGTESIDVAQLGFDYVSVVGGVTDAAGNEDFELIVDSGSTLELSGDIGNVGVEADTLTLTVNDADTGTADSVNVIAQAANGILVADEVENINIDAAAGDSTLALQANKVESMVITGEEFVNLSDAAGYAGAAADYSTVTAGSITNSGDSLTLIDASAMTGGGLVAVADGGVAQEILGGDGDDILKADGSGDTLNGNAGADTLIGANLTELYGGDGEDTFVMNTPTNVNSYSTIMDPEAGDVIDLSNVTSTGQSFVSSEVTLAETAVFQDYANEAVNQLAADDENFAWFQFDGNTYIVGNDDQTDATDANFENGVDSIIQIMGTVDLSTASYNQTYGTLEIA
jgi:S-layer protein